MPARFLASRRGDWTTLERCTAQLGNGDFCDAPSMPDAPFPVCLDHARQAYSYVGDFIQEIVTGRKRSARAQQPAAKTAEPESRTPPTMTPEPGLPGGVYFIQCGDLIKIGASANIARRLKAYPPNAEILLLLEHSQPDAFRLEQELHIHFRKHRAGRHEWYHVAQPILDYIEEAKRAAAAA